MLRKTVFISFLSMTALFVAAQDKKATLFTVAGQPVSVGDFEYVYTKNNINNQADYSEKSLRDYLNLYENFRLKVKEAEAMKLDTIASLKNELEGYRKQLAKSYLTDKEISDQLIREAYDHLSKEIDVSHILVRLDENANPADTAAAYKKIMDIKKRLNKGEDFGTLAIQFSEDPSAKQNKGDIGYFTAFMTVYPFEAAAYQLKPGEVSNPVRTQFGYHLIKMNNMRKAQGDIHVAQLLLKFLPEMTDADKAAVKTKIDKIYSDLQSGAIKWEDAVAQFSEDRATKDKNGELQWFGTGKMLPEYEAAAFGIAKDGDLAKPIQTKLGWHIIKRLEKREIPPFDEIKNDLKKRVERDSRSSVAKNKLIDRIKRENNFQVFELNKNIYLSTADSSVLSNSFNTKAMENLNNTVLFKLAGNEYKGDAFTSFLSKNVRRRNDKSKDALMNEYFEAWVDMACLNYEETQLENKKPDFKNLMQEYRDGILLFELTDRMVWGKALKDTVGLQAFYEQNKTKYMWPERAEAEIFNCSTKKVADAAYKMAQKGKSASDIQAKLNKDAAKGKVSVITKKFEKEEYDVVDKAGWKVGISPLKMNADSTYQFVYTRRIVQPEPKTLKEAKGFVVSDYQQALESSWLADLKNKYPIILNESVFRSLIKK